VTSDPPSAPPPGPVESPAQTAPARPLQTTRAPAAPPPVSPVTVGKLVGRAFSTWRACVLPFAALGLLLQAALLALGWALGSPFTLFERSPFRQPSPATVAWAFSARYWAYVASAMLLSVLVMGGLTGGAIQRLAGRPVTVGGMLGSTVRRAPALVAAGALALLATYLGMLLLVVPGILWGLSFSLAAPVVMAEPLGAWASLKRSRSLARGSRSALLGTYFICGVAAAAPSWLGMGLAMAAPLPGGLLTLVGSVLLGPILYVAPAVAYHDLRVAKEGASTAELARVFE